MKRGKDWSTWKEQDRQAAPGSWGLVRSGARAWLCLACCILAAGCGHTVQRRGPVASDRATSRESATQDRGVAENYQVGCPDVLAIDVAGRSDLSTRQPIGPDGRIDLGNHGKIRVEGRSPVQVAAFIAEAVGADPAIVRVRVMEYRSQQVFLFGQAVGWQRSVPYQGQETVLELLQRVGGIHPGAGPSDIYVVRSHIAEGGRPEVYHVDLQAIVVGQDQKTNLRLLPNDQIYIGATRQEHIEQILPPWLRPLHQVVWSTPRSE